MLQWFQSARGRKSNQVSFASPTEIEAAFDAESDNLRWLARLVTGDVHAAERCVTDARRISSARSGLFSDWLKQWARSATIQQAIEHSRYDIAASAITYEKSRCDHSGHEPPSWEVIERFRAMSLDQVKSELDPFVRAVMALRGGQRCNIQECALRLASTRSAVMAACCVLDEWLRTERPSSVGNIALPICGTNQTSDSSKADSK